MAKNKKKRAAKKEAAPADKVIAAIHDTGVVEVIRDHSQEGQIHLLCRVHHKKLWVAIMEYVLVRRKLFSEHLCQQYFVRGGKLVYGWTFIMDPAQTMDEAVAEFVKFMEQAVQVVPKRVMKGQLSSFPLVGAGGYRTASIQFDPRLPGPGRGGPSHKGAYSVRTEE